MLGNCLIYHTSSSSSFLTSRYRVVGALQRPETLLLLLFSMRLFGDTHLQLRAPLLDPCERELSGLLGVPLPTLKRLGIGGD